jgi:two-component system chemotaxis response regulator CheY
MIIAGTKDEQDRLEHMFSAYGFDLTSPANANDALDQCDSEMPDVIVVPENMKDMDVFSFIKHLRRTESGSGAAVFLCSDKPDSEKIGRAIWEGASDFLIEPFDAEVLDRKLKQAGVV